MVDAVFEITLASDSKVGVWRAIARLSIFTRRERREGTGRSGVYIWSGLA